ncbi:MAG: cellulase family glycosylhydrolase [Promethearchaeota archaeon]
MIPRLHIEKDRFVDEYGRRVILRGVNLGGDCKVPYPTGGTEFPSDFADHRDVSFVGRPFPLEDAKEHFTRLKAWGFNCLRLLTTWEAVEHQGPFLYDTKYLEYFTHICEMAGEFGFYIFIDFHQDVWSRMTGGDGAPGWIFEKVGIDYTTLGKADAAHVMQYKYQYDNPTARQPENYPQMSWSSNLSYPANGIMWTLFFGGKDFAPTMRIDGKNVQEYLQLHFINSVEEIAKLVSDLPNVIGFDSLNEPSEGWIGHFLDNRSELPANQPKALGKIWQPIQALYSSNGYTVELPVQRVNIFKGGIVSDSTYIANTSKQSIWFEGHSDPFQSAGAWRLNTDKSFTVLQNDFFRVREGNPVEFDRDYLFPFIQQLTKVIRNYNQDWMIFAEKPPGSSREFPLNVPENMVNASHWYDIVTLGTKRFNYPITLDFNRKKIVVGEKNIQKIYERHLAEIKATSENINNGCPTLIGEFGIPFDLENGKAYTSWAKGNRSTKIWKKHVLALDLMYNVMDKLLLNSTQWNYTAHNRNDLRVGDCWNQEDLSIFSIDQISDPVDISSGGRALKGFVRPFPHFVQGDLIEFSYKRKKKSFFMRFNADPKIKQPTEIFIPLLYFSQEFTVQSPNCNSEYDVDSQILLLKANLDGEITIRISDIK